MIMLQKDDDITEAKEVTITVESRKDEIDKQVFKFPRPEFINDNLGEISIVILIDKNNKRWWKGLNITNLLDYNNSDQTIGRLISDCNKKPLRNLISLDLINVDTMYSSSELKTIYISDEGIRELLDGSRKKGIRFVEQWLNNQVIPEISQKYDLTIFKRTDKTLENYSDKNMITEIQNKNILYLGYIGETKKSGYDSNFNIGEQAFKYGITNQYLIREATHKRNIDDFIIFYVQPCIFYEKLEKDFKNELKSKKLLRNCKFNTQKYTELFTTLPDFTIDDVKKYIICWVEKYDYDAKNKIKMKQTELDIELLRLQNESKKIELELMKLKNERDDINKKVT